MSISVHTVVKEHEISFPAFSSVGAADVTPGR